MDDPSSIIKVSPSAEIHPSSGISYPTDSTTSFSELALIGCSFCLFTFALMPAIFAKAAPTMYMDPVRITMVSSLEAAAAFSKALSKSGSHMASSADAGKAEVFTYSAMRTTKGGRRRRSCDDSS
jgi:hypothetical protein